MMIAWLKPRQPEMCFTLLPTGRAAASWICLPQTSGPFRTSQADFT